MADSPLIVPIFRIHSSPNAAKTKEAGRPVYDDVEVCEIRMAANKQTVGVFPAHEIWKYDRDPVTGDNAPITYAMRFPEQYHRFKNNHAQAQSGTPIEELPFLTQGKRLELKALNIYSAETLAALDGQPLKQLGMGGRELKDKAQDFLDMAAKAVDVSKVVSENEALKVRIAALEAFTPMAPSSPIGEVTPFDDFDDEALKEWIADATGARPKGNPNTVTLKRMAAEINDDLKVKASKAAA